MLAVTAGFLIWGLTPIYWKALQFIPATYLLAHRIVWSCVCLALLMAWKGWFSEFTALLRSWVSLRLAILAAVMIGTNWFLFIYAILSDRILETSLGYFINPFVVILLARMFLGETLRRVQGMALTIAAVAVCYLAIQSPFRPYLALMLAVTFAIYGLLKKTSGVNPVVGLFFETAVLAPWMMIYILMAPDHAWGDKNVGTMTLLLGTGVLTATPLLLFGWGVRRIPLITTGLLQYLAPSTSFMIGVLIYSEPFTRERAVAFGGVWIALFIYSVEGIWRARRLRGAVSGGREG